MTLNTVVDEEQLQNGIENSDDEEIEENGKVDDSSATAAKKKRKKKKKNKGRKFSIKDLIFPIQILL